MGEQARYKRLEIIKPDRKVLAAEIRRVAADGAADDGLAMYPATEPAGLVDCPKAGERVSSSDCFPLFCEFWAGRGALQVFCRFGAEVSCDGKRTT